MHSNARQQFASAVPMPGLALCMCFNIWETCLLAVMPIVR